MRLAIVGDAREQARECVENPSALTQAEGRVPDEDKRLAVARPPVRLRVR
jgi:hypothetical protein